MKRDETVSKSALSDAGNTLNEYSEKLLNANSYEKIPSMEKNPFTFMLNDSVTMKYKNSGALSCVEKFEITDKDTGEVVSGINSNIMFRRKQYVDNEQFVKLYNDQMKSIFNLSLSAIKVFGYIMFEMQNLVNSDAVWFSLKGCMEFCEYTSHQMVYRGLSELLKKMIICKSDKPNQFWINPKYVFNGNRIIVFNEFITGNADYFDQTKKLK
jgi:hypothetical protein